MLLAALSPVGGLAQDAVVRVEENLRVEPNGDILGQLEPGTRVAAGPRRGGWTEATVQGFVYIPSLQVWPDAPLDLVVSAPEGENLRDAPSGRVLGRFESGTLLQEIERIPGWIEVRRTGWIWTESLEPDDLEPSERVGGPGAAGSDGSPGGSDDAPGAADGVAAVPGGVAGATDDAAAPADVAEETPASTARTGSVAPEAAAAGSSESRVLTGGAGGSAILNIPDGDTLGLAQQGSDLRVLDRDGSWARVRLEGWVWVPGTEDGPGGSEGRSSILTEVDLDELVSDPARYRGQLLELELEFISLERAEQVRTDFYEGEPFLLTRSAATSRRFVYVAVPQELLSQVEDLAPLEDIRVLGRLRSGAAALTGSPILDLVEVERVP